MSNSHCTGLLLIAALCFAGCATTPDQRPTPTVRESADWHFKGRDYEKAADEYGLIVSRFPGDWEAQFHYGMCLLQLGQLNEAQRALQIAHTQQPTNPAINDSLAEVLFQQGDQTRLFAFLRQDAQSRQTADAYRRLGEYAMKCNDLDTARLAVNTAIELDNGRTTEPYLLGARFAERIGDRELAIRRARQAYGINPHDPRVRAHLAELGQVAGPTIALEPGR